jgi:hypothetical protein
MLYKENAADNIEIAVKKALSSGAGSSQAVKHILFHNKTAGRQSFSSLDNWQTLPPPDVSVYGQIGGAI